MNEDIIVLNHFYSTLKDRLILVESRLDALENPEAQPSPEVPECTDPDIPSEADRIAMRESLRAGTLKGIEANKTDRNRAGGPITREGFDVA